MSRPATAARAAHWTSNISVIMDKSQALGLGLIIMSLGNLYGTMVTRLTEETGDENNRMYVILGILLSVLLLFGGLTLVLQLTKTKLQKRVYTLTAQEVTLQTNDPPPLPPPSFVVAREKVQLLPVSPSS